jgi:hypothetical protein
MMAFLGRMISRTGVRFNVDGNIISVIRFAGNCVGEDEKALTTEGAGAHRGMPEIQRTVVKI